MEKIVAEVSTRFASSGNQQLNGEIKNAIKKLSLLLKVDRAYIFYYNNEKKTFSNTYEWCITGIRRRKDILQNLPKDLFFSWTKKLKNNEIINISISDALLKKREKTRKKNYETKSAGSSLVLPIQYSGEIIGFIGFDSIRKSRKWANWEIRTLKFVTEIIGNALIRKELLEQNKKLKETQYYISKQKENCVSDEAILGTTDAIAFSATPSGRILWMNPAAEMFLGYKLLDVVHNKTIKDFYSRQALSNLKQELENGYNVIFKNDNELLLYLAKQIKHPVEFQLTAKDGKKLPVFLLVNAVFNESGIVKQFTVVSFDIRKSKKTQEALLLQSSAFENFAAALTISDSEGKVMWVNKSYTRLTGYSLGEIKGKKTGQFQKSGLQTGAFYKNLWETCLKGNIWNGELINKRKDGTLYPEEMTITPLKDKRGVTTHLVAVKHDLTEKKRAEERQRESDEINRALLNAIPDLLVRFDKKGTYLNVFTQSEDNLLIPKNKFLGKKVEEILPAESATTIMKNVGSALNSGKVEKFETKVIYEENKKLFENRIVAISDSEVLMISRDITEQKKLENAHASTLHQLSKLIEHIHSGIFFINSNYKVIHINKKCCDMFGIKESPDEIKGMPGQKIIKIINQMLVTPLDTQFFINSEIYPEQKIIGKELLLKNGKIYETNYIPIKNQNKVSCHLFQYRDITVLKKAEKYSSLQRELGYKLAVISSLREALVLIKNVFQKVDENIQFGVYLLNPVTNILELKISSGFSEQFNELEKQYKPDTPVYKAVQGGSQIFKKCKEKDLKIYSSKEVEYFGIIPIVYGNQILGSVNIICQDNFPDKDLKTFFNAITAQFGGGIFRIYTQNKLILSQKNFRLMFERIDDIIFVFNSDEKIISSNLAAKKFLGYSANELRNLSILSVYPSELREELSYILNKMLDRNSYTCFFPLKSKQGKLIPVETRVVRGRWYDEKVFYAISRDVSEKKEANKKLREVEEHWHFTLETTGVGTWDWNIETGEVYYSKQWKQMLGYHEVEISNTMSEWKKRIHPDDVVKTTEDIESHIKQDSSVFMNEHRLLCKSGEYKWVFSTGKIISWNDYGAPVRMIGTQTDITKHKNLERTLVSALKKEKELNEMKSQFVSMTSHEFRTPLATMLITTDTLENYWERMSKEDISRKLVRIRNNIQFLKNIVENTMNLSRSESGNVVFKPEETELNDFILRISNDIGRSLGAKHKVNLVQSVEPVILKIDRRMMEEVISNLLANSIKYSEPGTRIDIKLERKESKIRIEVLDQGIGIPEADNQKIFDAFKRGNNVKNIHGTGLGLAISQQFIHKHGGTISFQSEVNVGTKFIIEIPT